ncbi:hypothetical protein [Mesorhizobium sp. SP-1A]|uniref:hypothetical protein n=1 Tax=Mesorhizobium sp. SP-1A TaxID=3077840 RepID=UPI0028F6C345|nr:hypothetical protein [Mesorhizobium sp. SP-1A]
MARATVLYIVPADGNVRAALEVAASECGAQVSGEPEEVGGTAEIDLEYCGDPIDDISEFIEILKRGGTPYFGMTESFTEPSRGLRCEGRIFVSGFGVELTKNFPWKEGEPELNERAMRIAGFEDSHIEAVTALFFGKSPAPKF